MPPNEIAPELTEQIGTLIERTKELSEAYAKDDADKAAVKANLEEVTGKIAELQAERTKREEAASFEKAVADTMTKLDGLSRTPSKAALIGTGASVRAAYESLSDTPLVAIAMAQSTRHAGEQLAGKAALEELGMDWAAPDPAAKATLGDTDAAGGYLVPNPVVMDINLQAAPGRSVVDLFTVIDGVRGNQVDIPWEQTLDARAVIAAVGATKQNSAFITNNYTATLYTLARIFDVSNQLLRQSAGAAERLVRSKLARAFALGEDYYAIQGSGSSEPFGLLTALVTSGTYVTSHTASATTLAGSSAAAIAKASGALANRGATPDGAVVNASDFWIMAAQGTDSAGFFFSPAGGPGNIDPTRGTLRVFGLDVRATPNMPSDSLVVGEYKNALFIRGQGYRVDTSDQAGTRWDTNLTGFRGEEEIAFDARPSVYTGHFQRVTDFTP